MVDVVLGLNSITIFPKQKVMAQWMTITIIKNSKKSGKLLVLLKVTSLVQYNKLVMKFLEYVSINSSSRNG